jgi:SAUR family protein
MFPRVVVVYVGNEGEKRQRFVILTMYINHCLSQTLLEEAEEEYRFEQKGTMTIPYHVTHF